MSRQTLCDGPDCEQQRPALSGDPDGYWAWLQIEANVDAENGDFCSWSCLANHAMRHVLASPCE